MSGTQHSGVDQLPQAGLEPHARAWSTLDFVPTGMIEKMASGMRFVKRAVEADLARFKAYVEFGDVKGLEYKSTPAEMEQNQGERGRRRRERRRAGSSGPRRRQR